MNYLVKPVPNEWLPLRTAGKFSELPLNVTCCM